jgi:hypothetical protein
VGEHTTIDVDFELDVQPILDRSCAPCHGPGTPLDLSDTPTEWFTAGYETLLADGDLSGNGKQWVDEPDGRASTSHLTELLLGEELDAPGAVFEPGVRHPEGELALTDEELRTLFRWMDLGATFVGGSGVAQ